MKYSRYRNIALIYLFNYLFYNKEQLLRVNYISRPLLASQPKTVFSTVLPASYLLWLNLWVDLSIFSKIVIFSTPWRDAKFLGGRTRAKLLKTYINKETTERILLIFFLEEFFLHTDIPNFSVDLQPETNYFPRVSWWKR